MGRHRHVRTCSRWGEDSLDISCLSCGAYFSYDEVWRRLQSFQPDLDLALRVIRRLIDDGYETIKFLDFVLGGEGEGDDWLASDAVQEAEALLAELGDGSPPVRS